MEQMPNRIRELRKQRGFYLEHLANRVGMSVTMLSDLERGNRDLTMHWMRAIARVLKVQPGDLLCEKDHSKSLTAAERELVDLYAQADEPQREQLLQMARILIGPKAGRKAA
jgi:transcriptional regulator with XRE-family HTH domain